MSHLVEARLGQDEVEEAARDAFTALDLTTGMRDGLRNGRIVRRLRSLRAHFDHAPRVPLAKDWIAAFDTAMVKRPGAR